MRRILFFLIISLFILALIFAAYGSVYCDPTRPPGFPANLPPKCSRQPAKAVTNQQVKGAVKPFTATYELAKGWNLVSFPFSSVLECKGFTYKLLRYSGGAYYAIDPVTEASQINTRWGYLAYADATVKVTARGIPNDGKIRSASLECGWNLMGCPSDESIPWEGLVAVISASTHRALDVTGLPGGKENYWISARAYLYDRGLVSIDIKSDKAAIKPEQGLWLFVWHPLTLTVLPGKEQLKALRINTVTPSSVAPGETVVVEGNGFGASISRLCISGIPVTEKYILSWSPFRIVFRVPPYSVSGCLAVCVNKTPSNKMEITISEGENQPAGATLMGRVQDGRKTPLRGALVMLGNGMSSYTVEDGTFVINHIPEGAHTVQGSLAGHRAANGKITLKEGSSKALMITLIAYSQVIPSPDTSTKKEPGEEQIISDKGTLYAVASAYNYGDKRWWVYRIDVSEWGNGNYSWHNTWYNDYGDVYYELKCPGARVNKLYNFKIEWRTKDGSKTYANTWQRKMYKQSQKENFDSPW